MPAFAASRPLNTTFRILLWFLSLVLSATLFSLFACRGIFQAIPFFFVFTLLFAMPAWALYLPLLAKFPGTSRKELWILAVTGFFIGPASILVWSAIFLSHGQPAQPFSFSNLGTRALGLMMAQAAIVGAVTTAFYVSALVLFKRKSAAPSIE